MQQDLMSMVQAADKTRQLLEEALAARTQRKRIHSDNGREATPRLERRSVPEEASVSEAQAGASGPLAGAGSFARSSEPLRPAQPAPPRRRPAVSRNRSFLHASNSPTPGPAAPTLSSSSSFALGRQTSATGSDVGSLIPSDPASTPSILGGQPTPHMPPPAPVLWHSGSSGDLARGTPLSSPGLRQPSPVWTSAGPQPGLASFGCAGGGSDGGWAGSASATAAAAGLLMRADTDGGMDMGGAGAAGPGYNMARAISLPTHATASLHVSASPRTSAEGYAWLPQQLGPQAPVSRICLAAAASAPAITQAQAQAPVFARQSAPAWIPSPRPSQDGAWASSASASLTQAQAQLQAQAQAQAQGLVGTGSLAFGSAGLGTAGGSSWVPMQHLQATYDAAQSPLLPTQPQPQPHLQSQRQLLSAPQQLQGLQLADQPTASEGPAWRGLVPDLGGLTRAPSEALSPQPCGAAATPPAVPATPPGPAAPGPAPEPMPWMASAAWAAHPPPAAPQLTAAPAGAWQALAAPAAASERPSGSGEARAGMLLDSAVCLGTFADFCVVSESNGSLGSARATAEAAAAAVSAAAEAGGWQLDGDPLLDLWL